MITIASFPIYLASILGLGLGLFLVFLYYRGVEERSTLYFGFFSLSEAIHSFGYAMLQNAQNFKDGLFWTRFLHIGAVLMVFFCVLFINDFLGIKTRIGRIIAYPFLVFLFLLPSRYFLNISSQAKLHKPAPYIAATGPLYIIFAALTLIAIFYIVSSLISYKKKYKKSGSEKLLMVNILIVIIIIIAVAGIYDLWGMFNEARIAPALPYALILLCLIFTVRIFLYHVDMVERLKKSYLSTILALINTLEAKDKYTVGHSQRVEKYAEIIAQGINLPKDQIALIKMAALLHDIGKIGIPDSIINKPGKLTEEEWVNMKKHPAKGTQILTPIDYLKQAREFVIDHHEHFDGSGYPAGLKGDEIPIEAQIISIADTFDAITTGRHYKRAVSFDEAVNEILKNKGTQFGDKAVAGFLNEKEKLRALLNIISRNIKKE